jgi:hypothetical protein
MTAIIESRSLAGLVAVLFEIFFYFECGHASGAGSGDGLTVAAVLNVSAGEDAGDDFSVVSGEDVVLREDVAVFVEIEHAFERGGIGGVADAEEHKADVEDGLFASEAVFEAEAFDVFVFYAEDFFDEGVGEELDLRMSHRAIEHDLGGAEALSAIDDGDLGGEAGEEHCFFHGAVAAADDGDLLTGGEEAVAGGAGADAVADEGLLRGQVEPASAGTAGDDEGASVDDVLADVEDEGGLGEIDGGEMGHGELGAEAGGLLLHVLDELRALDAFGPAGEVLHERGDGELAAGLVAFEDERLEIGAGGVDGGGESGAAGTEDDCVASCDVRHIGFLSVNA